jgi:hypothetical protein
MAMLITNFNKLIQSKIVWGLFIGLVVFAFVAMDMATPDASPQRSANDPIGIVFGDEITRQEFLTSYRNVYLIYSIMTGEALQVDEETDQALTEAAWNRLAVLKKAREQGYSASPEQIVTTIKNLPLFQNQQTGQFDTNAYNAFVDNFLAGLGMDAKAFEDAYEENIILEQAAQVAGEGILVTEEEVLETYHLLNDLITLDTALIPLKDTSAPRVSEAEAQAFYKANSATFELPAKASVHYVEFDVADYTAVVNVTDEMLTQVYSNNLERYRVEADPENPSATPSYLPLAEVRGALEAIVRTELARQEAFSAADNFVAALSDEGADFAIKANAAGKEVIKNIPPFSANETMEGIDPTAPFAKATFNLDLTPNQYYSDPVVGRDHIYVIALQKKLPAFIPAFEAVKQLAMEQAQQQADANAYREHVTSLYTQVQQAIADGTSFAAAINATSLSLETLAPFNSEQPLEHPQATTLMERTYQLKAAQLAAPIQTKSGVLLAAVKLRDEADTTKLSAQRPRIEASLIQQKKANRVSAWQASIVAEAAIEIFEDEPES